ncbi:hypothetical protein Z043_101381 [Scleropages formosus]|uniref:Uncharacterized protein n=1 Tax=Scleropages formosus TaxID=113540 RepID=A0A0P7XUX0_SCLFO|nr:hypothetical protein Z043_101381 [Scleropages formosus]
MHLHRQRSVTVRNSRRGYGPVFGRRGGAHLRSPALPYEFTALSPQLGLPLQQQRNELIVRQVFIGGGSLAQGLPKTRWMVDFSFSRPLTRTERPSFFSSGAAAVVSGLTGWGLKGAM